MTPDEPQKTLGKCPVCSAPIPDGKFGGGVWTGSPGAKAPSGPLLTVVCDGCAARLVAFPTAEELEQGKVEWVAQKEG